MIMKMSLTYAPSPYMLIGVVPIAHSAIRQPIPAALRPGVDIPVDPGGPAGIQTNPTRPGPTAGNETYTRRPTPPPNV